MADRRDIIIDALAEEIQNLRSAPQTLEPLHGPRLSDSLPTFAYVFIGVDNQTNFGQPGYFGYCVGVDLVDSKALVVTDLVTGGNDLRQLSRNAVANGLATQIPLSLLPMVDAPDPPTFAEMARAQRAIDRAIAIGLSMAQAANAERQRQSLLDNIVNAATLTRLGVPLSTAPVSGTGGGFPLSSRIAGLSGLGGAGLGGAMADPEAREPEPGAREPEPEAREPEPEARAEDREPEPEARAPQALGQAPVPQLEWTFSKQWVSREEDPIRTEPIRN